MDCRGNEGWGITENKENEKGVGYVKGNEGRGSEGNEERESRGNDWK